MITIASPLAFDVDGKPLHKHDLALYKDSNHDAMTILPTDEPPMQVEIQDTLMNNFITIIMPDGEIRRVPGGMVTKRERAKESSPEFTNVTAPVSEENESDQIGRARLMTPDNGLINGIAEVLLQLMKLVSKTVRPLQFKVDSIRHTKLASDGFVLEGEVQCQVQVQDMWSGRKGTANLKLAVAEGQVVAPETFTTSVGQTVPFTGAGFRKWLDIPASPYSSKKPSPVQRAYKLEY